MKWTWMSPNKQVKNEIDYVLANRKCDVQNTEVIRRINIGSDHRMVRTKVKINSKLERYKSLIKSKASQIDYDKLKETNFSIELRNRFSNLEIEDIEIDVESTLIGIGEEASKAAGKRKQLSKDKLTQKTKDLMKKRREMKVSYTPLENIEYTELCKTIRKRVREDLRKFNNDIVERAI